MFSQRWPSHPTDLTKHFVKLHVAIDEGITHAVSITDGDISETVVLPYLVCDIDFPPDVVRADAAYLSKDKVQLITDLGAALFVKPRRQPELLSMGHPAWKHMLLRHREDPEGLANEYNLRWRHEAFFSKPKRRFGPPKSRNGMMRCKGVWMRILILNILAVAGEQVEEELKLAE